METNDEKIEALIEKLMSNDTLEQPPLNFTASVMEDIASVSNTKVRVYKPLIPAYSWMIIILSVSVLFAYMYFKAPSTTVSWVDKFGLTNVSYPFENLTFNVSSTLMYAIVFFALMLCIQIPVLKHYFNKRLSV